MTTTTKNLTVDVVDIIVELTPTIEATVNQCIKISIADVTKEELEVLKKDLNGENITWDECNALSSLDQKERLAIAKRLSLNADQIQGWEYRKEWSC